MVCPELEMVLMMMMMMMMVMMVMMMKLARVTVPWRCVFFFYYYVVFLWKPLNAALIAVWLFVTWGQIGYILCRP